MRLLPPTVFILAPAAIGAVGAGMVYAQSSPRATVLVLTSEEDPSEGPSLDAFAAALRKRGRTRPLLREGSGVHLASDGRVAPGTIEQGGEALERGREHLRLLQFPEAESALEESARALGDVGTPEAQSLWREAAISLAVARLESGRRDASLRTFVSALTRDARLELDPVRYSPYVREALDQAKATIALLPKGGLRVESTPPGLDVWVDGRPVGRTPVAVADLVSGDHVVAMAAPDSPWSRRVAVPAGESARIAVLAERGSGAPADTALRVARAMDADRFVILSAGPQGRVRGRVGDVTTGRLGVARESDNEANLAQALEEELAFRVAAVTLGNGQDGRTRGERTPWYEKWWVYAIGVGVVGGAITAMAVAQTAEGDDGQVTPP